MLAFLALFSKANRLSIRIGIGIRIGIRAGFYITLTASLVHPLFLFFPPAFPPPPLSSPPLTRRSQRIIQYSSRVRDYIRLTSQVIVKPILLKHTHLLFHYTLATRDIILLIAILYTLTLKIQLISEGFIVAKVIVRQCKTFNYIELKRPSIISLSSSVPISKIYWHSLYNYYRTRS